MICKKEELQATDEAIQLIAKISEWCVRDAVKYIDQVSVLGNVNEEQITKFLWVASDTLIIDFLELIKAGDPKSIFERVDEIHNQWIDLHSFAKQTLMHIDQTFLNDINFSSDMSEIFTNIIEKIRFYPYPTIIYKVAINTYLSKKQ
jgi:DNA polymerase III gamma/tau subunit